MRGRPGPLTIGRFVQIAGDVIRNRSLGPLTETPAGDLSLRQTTVP